MLKLAFILSTIFLSIMLFSSTGFCQGRNNIAQPDSSAEQTIGKPDQRKIPSKKLLEVVDEVLKQQQHKRESSLGYEIDGLLIDETLTKLGHDFYDVFYSGWEAPPKINNYTIKIKEKPSLGRGFLITVLVNDEPIMEQNLQPNLVMIEETALYAITLTTDYLNNYEKLQNQIESDDQKGTGLY